MVKTEVIVAADPRDPRERHRLFLTLQLQGCQEASREAPDPGCFLSLPKAAKPP